MTDATLHDNAHITLNYEPKVAFGFVTSTGAYFLKVYNDNTIWIDPSYRNNEGAIEFFKSVMMVQSLSSGATSLRLPDQSVLDLLLLEDDIRREANISRGMNEHPAIRDRLLEFADRLNKSMITLEAPDVEVRSGG